jgi:hypothetical protein
MHISMIPYFGAMFIIYKFPITVSALKFRKLSNFFSCVIQRVRIFGMKTKLVSDISHVFLSIFYQQSIMNLQIEAEIFGKL